MRVVYDTNVLATITSRREDMIRVQRMAFTGQITLVTSAFILTELETVLSSRFGLTKQAAKSRVRFVQRIAEVVQPVNIEKVSRDPDDDYILATAVTGNADLIVTLDKDLLVLKEYKGIRIVHSATTTMP